MGTIFALIAGMFIPLTNLCLKKCVDISGDAKAFFVLQMGSSFIIALSFGPLLEKNFSVSLSTALFGIITGVTLALMLLCLGKAIEKGPPGFTFAMLHSATIVPGLLMAIIFGVTFGYEYNFWHGAGSFLVLVGLFLGAKGMVEIKERNKWLLFSFATFGFHVLLLFLFQLKAVMANHVETFNLLTLEEIQNPWFTPFMFLSCGLIQFMIYLRADREVSKRGEVYFGLAGGVFNFLCTFFLIWATEVASSLENAIIFPIYSVVGIILTNLWGQKLYQERVNWKACQLSVFGLIIGMVNWKVIAASIRSLGL